MTHSCHRLVMDTHKIMCMSTLVTPCLCAVAVYLELVDDNHCTH